MGRGLFDFPEGGQLTGSAGIVKTEYADFDVELQLESGRLLGPIRIAYETYGTLNAARSNAVLVCHAWTGDAHAAGRHREDDRKPGWWDDMIGPSKLLDTRRYFVICSNVIGSCKGSTGPASINPRTGRPYNLSFPVLMVRDMVRAQKLLLDRLGIDSLLTVIGGSMGAMQALEWAVLYPEAVRSIIPIAGTGRTSPMAISLNALARHALQEYDAGRTRSLEEIAEERGIEHVDAIDEGSRFNVLRAVDDRRVDARRATQVLRSTGDLATELVRTQRILPRPDVHPRASLLPVDCAREGVVRGVEVERARGRLRKAARALRHVEHEVVHVTVGAAADTPLRFPVRVLGAIEDERDLVRQLGQVRLLGAPALMPDDTGKGGLAGHPHDDLRLRQGQPPDAERDATVVRRGAPHDQPWLA